MCEFYAKNLESFKLIKVQKPIPNIFRVVKPKDIKVAFFTKDMSPTETNFDIEEYELDYGLSSVSDRPVYILKNLTTNVSYE